MQETFAVKGPDQEAPKASSVLLLIFIATANGEYTARPKKEGSANDFPQSSQETIVRHKCAR